MGDIKDTLLKIEGLKVYAGGNREFLRIVNDVSFEIKDGEVLALFGECGSGKTTIAHSIIGIINYIPGIIGGKIFLKGENLLEGLDKVCLVSNNGSVLEIKKEIKRWRKEYEERMRRIRGKKLFLVMQGASSSLNPFWNIREQVEMYSVNKSKVEGIFRRLKIANRMQHYPNQLSGGECQRALLAKILISQADLLIIDEPTVGIDEELMEEIIKLFIEYKNGKFGDNSAYSMLLISHDLQVIKELADKIVVICGGRVVELGDKEEVIKNPRHPYTKRLIESNEVPTNKNEPLPVIKGFIPLVYKEYKGCMFCSRCEVKGEICSFQEPELIDLGKNHIVRCYNFIKND